MDKYGNRETILLKGMHLAKHEEAAAAEEVFPGQFVELDADGKLVKAAGNTPVRRVVLENDLIGQGIRDSYAAEENVRYAVLSSGDVVNARVPSGTAAFTFATVVSFDPATGFALPGSGNPIGDVREPLDNSGGTQEEFVPVTIA